MNLHRQTRRVLYTPQNFIVMGVTTTNQINIYKLYQKVKAYGLTLYKLMSTVERYICSVHAKPNPICTLHTNTIRLNWTKIGCGYEHKHLIVSNFCPEEVLYHFIAIQNFSNIHYAYWLQQKLRNPSLAYQIISQYFLH